MQLTKDEINTIWSDCQDTGNATRESIAAAVIATHTAKVLEGVEPVARLLTWNGPKHCPIPHGGIAARTFAEFDKDTPAKDRYWFEGELLYPAHTVAALKSRADALAARVAELEKDARRLDAVERNRFELTPLEGGGWDVSQYHSETCDSQLFAVGELTARAAIDSAALAAKGQA